MKIKIFSLGGLDEIGKNCLVIEIDEEIYIFDCGLKYLNYIDLGINSVIPDFAYLIKNQSRIRGLMLSKVEIAKAHGLSYLLKQLPQIPIFLSQASFEILKDSQLLTKKQIQQNLHIIKEENIQFPKHQICTFDTASNMPGSLGFILQTQWGNIVYTGSIVVNLQSSKKMFSTNLKALVQAKNKTLLLISNMDQIKRKGFTVPHNQIHHIVEQAYEKTQQNLYIGCYDNDWYKIYSLIQHLKTHFTNTHFTFIDKKFETVFRRVIALFDSSFASLSFVSSENVKRRENSKNVIIFTGNQSWLFSRMHRLLNPKAQTLNLTKKDYVLILGENKFNTELSIYNVLNELYHSEAKIEFIAETKVATMEAAEEDLKLLVNLIQPRYFMPFNGYFTDLVHGQKLVQNTAPGVEKSFVLENGQILAYEKNHFLKKTEFEQSQSVFVDNLNNSNISNKIIDERKHLSIEGILFVGFAYQKMNSRWMLTSSIKIQTMGLTNDSIKKEKILNLIQQKIEIIFKNKQLNGELDNIKKLTHSTVQETIYHELRKKPFILPMIICE